MKKLNKLLILTLIILSILPISYAYQIKTTAIAGQICPRETGLYTLNVKNTESYSRSFTLSLTEDAAEWTTIFPQSFMLTPNEEKIIYIYVTPKQDTIPGAYQLTVNIESNSEKQKLDYAILVKECYSTLLTTPQKVLELCPREHSKYTISLANTGDYSDTYSLSTESQLDQISLQDQTLQVDMSKSKLTTLNVISPQKEGEYTILFNAVSQLTKAKSTLPLSLKVKPCYDFNFLQPQSKEIQLCERTINYARFGITNLGTVSNTYKISLKGPEWTRLSQEELVLLPSENKLFDLIVYPNFGNSGEYKAELEIMPKNGDKKVQSEIKLKVKQCQNIEIKPQTSEISICKGSSSTITLLMQNTGESTNAFETLLEAPTWTLYQIPVTNLKANETKNFTLTFNPEQEIKPGDYTIKIKINAFGEAKEVAKDEKTINVKVKDTLECYGSNIKTNYENIVVYYDSSVAVPLTIKNDGTNEANYKLELLGSASQFIRINPDRLTLSPGKTETLFLYISPKIDTKLEVYNIILNVKSSDTTVATKQFTVGLTDKKEEATVITQSDNQITGSAIGPIIKEYKWLILIGAVILTLIILMGIFGWHKKLLDFLEDEEDLDSEKN